MKRIINKRLLIIFFPFVISCVVATNSNLEEKVSAWADKNCRISSPLQFENIDGKIINIIIRENSKIGSAETEKISSDNLAYLIAQNTDTSKLERISIKFDLPKSVAVYGKEGKKVSKNYIFEDFALLNKYFSNYTLLKLSNYITFNLDNSDQLNLERTLNLCRESFEWFDFQEKEPLAMYLNYPFIKDKKTRYKYRMAFAMFKEVEIMAEVKDIYHVDSLNTIIENVPMELSLYEIDSLAKNQ